MSAIKTTDVTIPGTKGDAPWTRFLPECDTGPGLVLAGDSEGGQASLTERATLFAEEGYVVMLAPEGADAADISLAVDRLAESRETISGVACVAHGTAGIMALAAADSFAAIVVFDAPNTAGLTDTVANAPCPIVFQFGSMGDTEANTAAAALQRAIDPINGSRVYTWPDASPGFALPGHAAFDRRVDSLAHSRTLELIRRVVGPYYDYVALFAEHIRHEFETRDVDATMATMIDAPYVNHVATLAGGVGHDMLKRFYKYHFVEQNSKDRSSVTVSHTLGPDRVVLELVVRFKHDQVLDRYFPNIPPTDETIELATVLIVKFRGDKVCHEHIYWDQGSALKQIGVLDTGTLPVAGAEAARKVLDEHQASNIFMQEAWATSEGKPL